MWNLQLGAESIRDRQRIARRKTYIGILLIDLGRRYISHPGHTFRCAVVTRRDWRRCGTTADWRWAAFRRAGIRVGVHCARNSRVAQCRTLSLSCNRQTADSKNSKSNSNKALFCLFDICVAHVEGGFHRSLGSFRSVHYSDWVWVSGLCDESRWSWLLKLTLNVRKSAPVCRWWSYAQRCGFSHYGRRMVEKSWLDLYIRTPGCQAGDGRGGKKKFRI